MVSAVRGHHEATGVQTEQRAGGLVGEAACRRQLLLLRAVVATGAAREQLTGLRGQATFVQRDELALGALGQCWRELEAGERGQLAGLLLVERLLRVACLEGRAEHARDGFLYLVGRVLVEGEGAADAAVEDARDALNSGLESLKTVGR